MLDVEQDRKRKEEIKERLKMAGIKMDAHDFYRYCEMYDDLGDHDGNDTYKIPLGYKRCGKCHHVLKLYMFNKNKESKTGCTGNCKACQKESARKSYKRTKQKREAKRRYEKNKDVKREQARQYYQENKEDMLKQQKKYHSTKKGKKVMHSAHMRRYQAMKENMGIPYTREQVIDRDSKFLGKKYPICNICGKPITSTKGEDLHLDHVVPIVMGGKECFTNIACVHATCNLTKTKDARDQTNKEVDRIVKRANDYMELHREMLELI